MQRRTRDAKKTTQVYNEEDSNEFDNHLENVETKKIIAAAHIDNIDSEEISDSNDDDLDFEEDESFSGEDEKSEEDSDVSDDIKTGKKRAKEKSKPANKESDTKEKTEKEKPTAKPKKEKAPAKPKKEKAPAKPKKEKAPKEKKEKVPKEKKEKVPKVKKEKAPKVIKEKILLDPAYDLNKAYFYQDLSEAEWTEITEFIKNYFTSTSIEVDTLSNFFKKFPYLRKGEHNIQKLKSIIDLQFDLNVNTPNSLEFIKFKLYKNLNDYVTNEFFVIKPSVLECHFFPNQNNEIHVVNMIRTCKQSLDVAIFTLTNDKIAAAIEEAFNRGIRVRVIADDECCKMWGSDCVKLASLGIDLKTDNKVIYHMHHKFAVLDNSVVITGSFNWTMQAVKFNQENILFYENKIIASQYTKEFDRLWNDFTTVIK